MSDTKKEEEHKRFSVAEKFLMILAIHKVSPQIIKNFVFQSFNGIKDWMEASTPFTTLAKAVGAEVKQNPSASSVDIMDVVDKIPGAVGDQIHKVCFENEQCKQMVSRETLGNLVVVGIPLAIYLYVKFKGTDEEKENMETKLREARRMTEETSDRRIKRRRTNKLRELTETEIPISMSEVTKHRRTNKLRELTATEIPISMSEVKSSSSRPKRQGVKSNSSSGSPKRREVKKSVRPRKSARKHQ